MANTTGLNATEIAGSVGLILAVLVEVGALLGNGALLVVVLRTPGLQDALYLVHLCIVDLLAAASIMPLGLLAAPPPGLGRPPLRPRLPGGKAALAPALAVGQFAACWLPYGCACLAPAARAAEAEAAVTWVAYSAFAAHPFLYGLLQRPIRLTLGRLTRCALPRTPGTCTLHAWQPRALLQRLQGAPQGPALGPSEAPDPARELAGGQSPSMPEAT
ncbi:G-protein coupled receptor 62 [Marmota marmota marmota]|uniref:G-protein coupled receptor 62 n=1 Tax=Marmota marmota marmota TaxID=9994 RepID=UPI00209225F1|nr:G-protein coupled receptor 62 [Marmota marmota marmota]